MNNIDKLIRFDSPRHQRYWSNFNDIIDFKTHWHSIIDRDTNLINVEFALSICLLFRIILSNLGTLSAGAPVKKLVFVVAGAN